MPRAWKLLLLLPLVAASTGAVGWGEEQRLAPREEQLEKEMLQDLEIVKELEMLQMLEMLREMETLSEIDPLLPPRSKGEEESR
ncbi:MAG: hypothetical protein ACE5JU_08015 [Candidatus Binatia bacterium]